MLTTPTHPRGFDEFFRADLAKLIGYVMRRGFSFEQAEDAVNQAMLLLYEKWDRVQHPTSWVRTVAGRIARRDKMRGDKVITSIKTRERPTAGEVDLAMSSVVEELPLVRERLECLPIGQRRVMELHLAGYTNSEIAEELDTPSSTVRSNLRHARNRLQALLGSETTGQ